MPDALATAAARTFGWDASLEVSEGGPPLVPEVPPITTQSAELTQSPTLSFRIHICYKETQMI
eukprot:3381331-Amphidinium_carterae.1